MARRELTCRELRAQVDTDRIVVGFAQQGRFEPIDQRELFHRLERGVVRDVIGGSHEFVEGEYGRAVARVNQPGGYREILVPMAFARTRVSGGNHHCSETLACRRPFQLPPRPRIYWQAESSVKIMYSRAIAGIARPHNGESR